MLASESMQGLCGMHACRRQRGNPGQKKARNGGPFRALLPPPRRVRGDREGNVIQVARCSAKRNCRVQEVSSADRLPSTKVAEHFTRGVAARKARDATAGVRAGAAQIQGLQGPAVISLPQQRPRREQLVEPQGAVEDVAAHQAEAALQVEWRQRLVAQYAGAEVR